MCVYKYNAYRVGVAFSNDYPEAVTVDNSYCGVPCTSGSESCRMLQAISALCFLKPCIKREGFKAFGRIMTVPLYSLPVIQ